MHYTKEYILFHVDQLLYQKISTLHIYQEYFTMLPNKKNTYLYLFTKNTIEWINQTMEVSNSKIQSQRLRVITDLIGHENSIEV